MNKSQLIDLLAEKTRLTKNQSEHVFDAAIEIIQAAVSKGEEVKIVGFGTFSRVARKARPGRNPKTGEKVTIPATGIPRFRPGKDFKSNVNKN